MPTVIKEFPEIGWGRGSNGRNLVVPMALGATLTAFCGRPINVFFNEFCGAKALSIAFGAFMFFILFQTLFGKARDYATDAPVFTRKTRLLAFATGLGAGVFSSVLGVGGAMVFRPALANGFKTPERDTGLCVRLLLLVTTTIGGLTYLFSRDGFSWTILVLSALIAVGGLIGFPLGVTRHKMVVAAGRAAQARRSFAIICGIVVTNVTLTLVGMAPLSRVLMFVVAVALAIYIESFARFAKRHPLATPDAPKK
ncbi:MAG: sulfite exporter TauE/SafE family protein [Thermoguttaceae bacterium]|nr:sulfite exporter TauE/SafE family protein [Thermoguttaceae bacterium]